MTQADDNAAAKDAGKPRKRLSKEAREEMKRQLKQELRLFADELKKQIRKKEGQKPSLEDAMKKAEAAVEEKMNAEALAARSRDVMELSAPDAGQAEDAGQGKAQAQTEKEKKEPKGHESAIPVPELNRLTQEIIAQLKTIYDPEIPVDIYELGLIYRIDISDDHVITIDMTLTAPGCPVAGDMPGWVEKAVKEVAGVKEVRVNLVFDPPWDMSRMSDEARLALNMW